jgi:DNA-binding MarR family transcriptional regulator
MVINESGATPRPSDPAAAEIDDLAGFLVLTNRIATRLQATAAFSPSGVSLADWLMLHAIGDAGSGSFAEVARRVGVSRQRVQQQAGELADAGLVDISREGAGNARGLSLSPRGQEALSAISGRLQEFLTSSDASLAAQIRGARRSTARLAKRFASPRAPVAEGTEHPTIP